MRRSLKVAAWAAAFLAAAGAGALVAAHSNPFPPGVEDPGLRSTVSATPSATPSPASQSWALTFRSETSHDLFVGGSCTTRWHGRIAFTADGQGHLQGSGQADLAGSRVCTFPNAQLQVRTIRLELQGEVFGNRFLFRLGERGRVPIDARDYGGFTNTLLRHSLRVVARQGSAATVHLSRQDETGRGTFVSSTRFVLASPPSG